MSLEYYFNPRSIAVIGASDDAGKAGYQIYKNLLELGFAGRVYPVNPKLGTLFGNPCYPSLKEIGEPVELMVISVPAFGVPDIFRQAAARGDVKAAVIIASGFSETRIPERVALEKEVMETARAAGIRVMGPNCVGVMNTANHLDTTFAAGIRQVPGGMSVISQSGSLGAAIMMFATHLPVPIGFAKWAHVGNQVDVDVLEVMRFYRDDPDTKVIALYMEGINNARAFLEVARDVCQTKPIIALKVGRSEAGSAAAASHTGSLVGADAIYDAAFRQAGIIRVDTIGELLDTAKAVSMQPLPTGNRIAVLTEAGGPGIIAMDELGFSPQVTMAPMNSATLDALKAVLPPMAIIDHTVGYVDMSAAADEQHHKKAMELVLADPNVDGVVHLSVPPTFLKPDKMASCTAEALTGSSKPVTVCYLAGAWVESGEKILEAAGVPTFGTPERAARAMRNMVLRRAMLDRAVGGEWQEVKALSAVSRSLIEANLKSKAHLTELEARAILGESGITFDEAYAASDARAAGKAFMKIGKPVVMKILSPDVLHKSDIGGVKVGLKDEVAVEEAFDAIVSGVRKAVPGADIQGVMIAPMAPEGTEMIVGAVRDPQFGPVVMVGFGGIFVEVLKDVAFRIAPFDKREAEVMIGELRLASILKGVRGQPPADIKALADIAVAVGSLMLRCPEIQEIDLNPVRLYPQGASPLDARIILSKE